MFGGSADQDEKSAYDGHRIDDVELGVALPFRFAGPRPQVRVTNRASGKSVVCNIVDVGPWNINDPYWEKGARPQAESGTDMRGRRTNGAGIDLTPGAARAISIPGKGVVDWEFVGAAQGPQPNAQALLPIVALLQKFVKDGAIKMPLPANDISAIIQLLLKVAQGQNAAPGSVVPPAPAPALDPADPTKQLIDEILKLVLPQVTKQIPQLGQVNGALGQTIGELLNGKKTAIGLFGTLASWLAPIIGSSSLFGGAGMDIAERSSCDGQMEAGSHTNKAIFPLSSIAFCSRGGCSYRNSNARNSSAVIPGSRLARPGMTAPTRSNPD